MGKLDRPYFVALPSCGVSLDVIVSPGCKLDEFDLYGHCLCHITTNLGMFALRYNILYFRMFALRYNILYFRNYVFKNVCHSGM